MTTEEKAKAYDEAKARMSRAFNSNRCTIGFMNEIFPELKESEDEKIRKFLIKWIQDNYYHGTTEIPTKTLIAWLEKHYTKRDVDDAYVEGMVFAKNELEKQKHAWSEADEKILKEIISDVKFEGYNNDMQANSYKKINWLKSIKDRVIIQSKQEFNKNNKEKNLCERCLEAPVNSKERTQILAECKSQSCWFKGY